MPTEDMKNSAVSIENIQYEAQELSGIDDTTPESEDGLSYNEVQRVVDSYPSVPALRINVPEAQDPKASFKYNFFLPDEREVINNAGEVTDLSVSRSDEIFFQMSNDRMPRYVELSFKPPKKYSRIKEIRNSRREGNNNEKQ